MCRDYSRGGNFIPLTSGGSSKQPKHQHKHRVGKRRIKRIILGTQIQILRVILVNIMICIILICVVGYMFHRAVINRTHRHALKSTQQQHVRGRQNGHKSLLAQPHNHNNGSSQSQHIKKKNRRQHTIIHEFISKSYPY